MRSSKNEKILCSDCFKSLGVSTRVAIFSFLQRKGKSSVNEIVEEIGLTQPTISYHLKGMKQPGLLKSRRKGKEVYYEIDFSCPYLKQDCVLSTFLIPVKNVKS